MEETLTRPTSPEGEIQLLPPWVLVEAYDIEEVKGSVAGISIRDLGFFREVEASIREVIGGGVKGLEKEYVQAHTEAVGRVREEAEKLGANTILNFDVTDEIIRDLETGNLLIKAVAEGVAAVLKDEKQVI
ncbi:heavy metal-binding domain-containing protein [Candidatus Dojkabacteria bacterium]|nr:heavy metal-binding domain-containing protein [Candidatus Dojkabacteria bacterium]